MESESSGVDNFTRNLNALRKRGVNALPDRLLEADSSGHLRIERAKSGEAVPVYEKDGGERRLYSGYSPGKEAERLAGSVTPSQSVIVSGIGSGMHVRRLLDLRSPVHVTVILEPFELLVTLVRSFNFESLFSDPRVSIVDVPCSLATGRWEELCNAASEIATRTFVPLFTRGLATMIPAGIRTNFPEFAAVARDAVQHAGERVSADLTAQKRFGRLWMRNILLNLPRARASALPPQGPERLFVAAAGPSLEHWIAANHGEKDIVSTDTAAPALEAHNMEPFAVVSVDPSPFSYHHLLCGSSGKRWILDIAANPLLWRQAEHPHALYSNHPLLTLLSEHDKGGEPRLFSATDVTKTAVRFAAAIGARSIHLAGADFSYPKGSVYVKGSYIPLLFHAQSTRMSPSQTRHFAFAYRSPLASRSDSGTIHTPGLDAAKRQMDALAKELEPNVAVRFVADNGPPPAPTRESPESSTKDDGDHLQPPSNKDSIRTALHQIANELEAISEPNAETVPSDYYLSLSSREKQLINALVPTAMAMPGGDWYEQLYGARRYFFRLISDLYEI